MSKFLFENRNFVPESVDMSNMNTKIETLTDSAQNLDKQFMKSIKKMKSVAKPQIVITQDSDTTSLDNSTANPNGLLAVNAVTDVSEATKSDLSPSKYSNSSSLGASMMCQNLMVENEAKTQHAQYLVETRMVILKIGDIDTLNEKFCAEAFIEATWIDFNLSPSQKYDPDKDWNPKLHVLNCLGELKQQVWYSQYSIKQYEDSEKEKSNEKPFIIENNYMHFYTKGLKQINFRFFEKASVIVERRRINGQFWQTLDLKNFPADVQNLTISISSLKQASEIKLYQSKEKPSSVNIKAFVDSQEWKLYKHITVSEYLRDSILSVETFPAIDITINVARKPTFYYWNAFFLVFLITMASLSIFSIRCHLNQNRIQTTCTLLLTSVTFKWITNRSLPTVSYMTSLDKYSIACMLLLCAQCMWHAISSSMLEIEQKCDYPFALYDHIAFLFFCSVFCLIQVVFFIWLFKNAYRKRRLLNRQEVDYANELMGKRSTRLKSMLYGI